jgi:hypothetical protein
VHQFAPQRSGGIAAPPDLGLSSLVTLKLSACHAGEGA